LIEFNTFGKNIKMEKKYLSELHSEHQVWLNALKFYEDDIKILKDRLGEVSVKNTANDINAIVERFQNKLIIQKDELDKLKHEINLHEQEIEQNVKDNPVASDHRKLDDHSNLRDRMDTFELLINNLRKDMVLFFAKWM